jgi:8-oxo-dGTP pyrophosphatase MutT (NUDIX family)
LSWSVYIRGGGGESLTRESAMRETEEERGVECAYVSESDRLLCVPCGELHYAVAATN